MVAALRAEGLAKSFGRTAALRPLDLEVAEGEVLGYLGPNGAGKTTTIRCLLGFDPGERGPGGDLRRRRPGAAGRGAPPARLRARARPTCGRG